MKLKKIIAAVAIASCASSAFALSANENLTDGFGGLVKNNFGDCVKVNENNGLVNCGVQIEKSIINLSTDAYFDFDKSVLKQQGKLAIQEVAQKLNANKANVRHIVLDGYTDSVGNDQYNLALSERRANTVADFLVENGVPARIIEANGRGEVNPAATNETKAGRALNRRVVITVYAQVEKELR